MCRTRAPSVKIFACFLCLSFFTFDDSKAHAELPISHERFFELEWQGKRSYILATNHYFHDFSNKHIQVSIAALRRSNIVFLENSGRPEELVVQDQWNPNPNDFFVSPELIHFLSPKALMAYTQLLESHGNLSLFLRMKPGAAMQVVRNEFKRHRGQLIDRFFQLAANPGTSTALLTKFGHAGIHSNLLIAATLLMGRTISEDELIRAAVDRIMKDSRTPTNGMDSYIQTKAIEFKLPIHLLEQEETETELGTRLDKITADDLDHALTAISPFLTESTVASQFWNSVVLKYLCSELSQRHFATDAQILGTMTRLINKSASLTGETGTFLPGEESIEAQVSNRHKDWLEALAIAIKNGGAFIAVGAAHVIPHADSSVSETLLEMFAKEGIKIKPVFDCESFLN